MNILRGLLLAVFTVFTMAVGLLFLLIMFPLALLFGRRPPALRFTSSHERQEEDEDKAPHAAKSRFRAENVDFDDTIDVEAREVSDNPKTIEIGREPR